MVWPTLGSRKAKEQNRTAVDRSEIAILGYPSCLTPPAEGFPWDDLREIFSGCQWVAVVPNASEILPKNLNRLSRAHERYRLQTDRRQTDRQTTDDRRTIKNDHSQNYFDNCVNSPSVFEEFHVALNIQHLCARFNIAYL